MVSGSISLQPIMVIISSLNSGLLLVLLCVIIEHVFCERPAVSQGAPSVIDHYLRSETSVQDSGHNNPQISFINKEKIADLGRKLFLSTKDWKNLDSSRSAAPELVNVIKANKNAHANFRSISAKDGIFKSRIQANNMDWGLWGVLPYANTHSGMKSARQRLTHADNVIVDNPNEQVKNFSQNIYNEHVNQRKIYYDIFNFNNYKQLLKDTTLDSNSHANEKSGLQSIHLQHNLYKTGIIKRIKRNTKRNHQNHHRSHNMDGEISDDTVIGLIVGACLLGLLAVVLLVCACMR